MVYMCISVDAYAEYNVQASSAGDLCIHALLFSDTVLSFRCEEMLQIWNLNADKLCNLQVSVMFLFLPITLISLVSSNK